MNFNASNEINTMRPGKKRIVHSVWGLICCLAYICSVGPALASPAFDSAADAIYDDGWQTGDNGGYGWQPWVLTPAPFQHMFIVATSTLNGVTGGPDIDTNGRALGFNSAIGTGTWGYAERLLTSPMSIGETFVIDIDNGKFQNIGGRFVVSLRIGGVDAGWLDVIPTNGFYSFEDQTGGYGTTIPISSRGIRFELTQTSASAYAAKITRLDTLAVESWSGNLKVSGNIDGVWILDYEGGEDEPYHQFVNNMGVVPEPATIVALAAGAVALCARRRKARSMK